MALGNKGFFAPSWFPRPEQSGVEGVEPFFCTIANEGIPSVAYVENAGFGKCTVISSEVKCVHKNVYCQKGVGRVSMCSCIVHWLVSAQTVVGLNVL